MRFVTVITFLKSAGNLSSFCFSESSKGRKGNSKGTKLSQGIPLLIWFSFGRSACPFCPWDKIKGFVNIHGVARPRICQQVIFTNKERKYITNDLGGVRWLPSGREQCQILRAGVKMQTDFNKNGLCWVWSPCLTCPCVILLQETLCKCGIVVIMPD